MNRLLLGLTLVLTLFSGSVTAGKPIVRVSLSASQVLVGEPLKLSVDVLVPGWFTAPLQLPTTLPVARAMVRLDDGAALNLNERIDGVAYAGMRHTYSVSAQQAGKLVIQPFAIGVSFADGVGTVQTSERSPILTFVAALPRGAENLGYFLATSDYQLSDHFGRPLDKLKVGDAFSRTIIQTAAGTAAMNLPALVFPPVPGLAIYPDEAIIDDRVGQRGADHRATRHQTVRYVVQEAGRYSLSGIRISWFDTATRTMRIAHTRDHIFNVATDVAAVATIAPGGNAAGWDQSVIAATLSSLALLLKVILLFSLLAWLGRARLRNVVMTCRQRQQRRQLSEATAFQRLAASIRRRDDPSLINHLAYCWLLTWERNEGAMAGMSSRSLRSFADWVGNSVIAREWAAIEQMAYAPPQTEHRIAVDYQRLLSALKQARKVMRKQAHKNSSGLHLRAINDLI
jgi:hypothetical protein